MTTPPVNGRRKMRILVPLAIALVAAGSIGAYFFLRAGKVKPLASRR